MSINYNLLGFEYTNFRCFLCKADLGSCEEGQGYLQNVIGASMYSPRFPNYLMTLPRTLSDCFDLILLYTSSHLFLFPLYLWGHQQGFQRALFLTKSTFARQDSTRLAPSGRSLMSTICQAAASCNLHISGDSGRLTHRATFSHLTRRITNTTYLQALTWPGQLKLERYAS